MTKDTHTQYMHLALAEAKKGCYTTHPNPRVGCIITKANRIIAKGYHHKAGEPHAEIVALRKAKEPTEGATLYVSLEPCCHHGRTPPCTDAIVKAGIKTVYIATADPNPQVQHQGIARLQAAGIQVYEGILAEEAQSLNLGYWQRYTQSKPWIRVKLATSLDGRTTCLNNNGRLITNLASRQDVQHWRALSSAIVTGANTILTDSPQLNIRNIGVDNEGSRSKDSATRQPDLFVIDNPALTIPANAKIFDSERQIYWVTSHEQQARCKYLPSQVRILPVSCKSGTKYIDLTALSRAMAALEMNEVLVEAGRGISSQYIESGLTDELIIYQAPKLLGDQEKGMIKPNWQFSGIKLEIHSIKPFDQDIRYVARIIAEDQEQTKHTNQIL